MKMAKSGKQHGVAAWRHGVSERRRHRVAAASGMAASGAGIAKMAQRNGIARASWRRQRQAAAAQSARCAARGSIAAWRRRATASAAGRQKVCGGENSISGRNGGGRRSSKMAYRNGWRRWRNGGSGIAAWRETSAWRNVGVTLARMAAACRKTSRGASRHRHIGAHIWRVARQ